MLAAKKIRYNVCANQIKKRYASQSKQFYRLLTIFTCNKKRKINIEKHFIT